LQHLRNYKCVKTKFEDQVRVDQQLNVVGGLPLLRSNPIWLPVAILKNRYDAITLPVVDRFGLNFVEWQADDENTAKSKLEIE